MILSALLSLLFAPAAPAAGAEGCATAWIFKSEFVGETAVRRGVGRALCPGGLRELPELSENCVNAALDQGNLPNFIIHSYGTKTEVGILRSARARAGGRTKLILIGSTALPDDDYDVYVWPRHLPPVSGADPAKTVVIAGTPSQFVVADIHAAAVSKYSELPAPRTLALVGGRTANIYFGPEFAAGIGRILNRVRGGTLLITNSRRTPRNSYTHLLREARPDHFIDARSEDGDNPYLEMLAAADRIIVTADSSSMISDALVTGRPVHLIAPRNLMEERHVRFNLPLIKSGRVRLLREPLDVWHPEPVDVVGPIVEHCRRWLTE